MERVGKNVDIIEPVVGIGRACRGGGRRSRKWAPRRGRHDEVVQDI